MWFVINSLNFFRVPIFMFMDGGIGDNKLALLDVKNIGGNPNKQHGWSCSNLGWLLNNDFKVTFFVMCYFISLKWKLMKVLYFHYYLVWKIDMDDLNALCQWVLPYRNGH